MSKKTLLAIISHPKDNELVRRHWPYFKATGWDILGCGTLDKACTWPEVVARLDTGKMGKKMTPAGSAIYGLVDQELDIWDWFLKHPEYSDVCVVEADNLFVRQPPEHPGSGLYCITALPNYSKSHLFKTPVYFSTPRWPDRKCAEQLLANGRFMVEARDVEHWMSDRFPAWLCQRYRIPWIAHPGWSPPAFKYGAHTYEEVWVRDARAAIKLGAFCLHSVKFPWQLDAIKDLITWV